jgi:hypothetical protein
MLVAHSQKIEILKKHIDDTSSHNFDMRQTLEKQADAICKKKKMISDADKNNEDTKDLLTKFIV